jgi:predicted DNA repair protein MutK
MLGGAYLSYEGAEKVMEKLGGEHHGETLEDPIEDPAEFERDRINGAIRTDLILSAEIMAIALSEIQAMTDDFWIRAAALATVGVAITIAVYGAVALIVKMDDVGLHLADKRSAPARAIGRGLLHAMPRLLVALSVIGTVAMLWVGGGIILHGLEQLGVHGPADLAHGIQHAVEAATGALGGVLGWLSYAGLSALVGLALGAVIALLLHKVLKVGAGH